MSVSIVERIAIVRSLRGITLMISMMLISAQLLAQPRRKEHVVEHPTFYRTEQIDGLSIFYREAGPKNAPTILLLHGLPSSSRMFEPLFARLSDRYHLVAPDYPGFGHSDWPDPKKFAYTFDHSPKRSGSRATRFTCRITAARWVFAWPWPIRSASRRSSSRTLWRTTKAWGRIGRRGGPFGPIALPTKARFAQISCRWRRRARATSETTPTWIAMTRISGPMNFIFSISPARPTFRAICSTTIDQTWRPIRSGKHGCARSGRACW